MLPTDEQDILHDIFAQAISIETYGKEYYSIFSDLVQDENARAMLTRLSNDEGDHRDQLEKKYQARARRPIDVNILGRECRKKARSIFPESLEPLNIMETKEVLKLGIRTEIRSIELYADSADKIHDGSAKDLFLMLMDFEKGHKKTLERALDHLEREGAWQGLIT